VIYEIGNISYPYNLKSLLWEISPTLYQLNRLGHLNLTAPTCLFCRNHFVFWVGIGCQVIPWDSRYGGDIKFYMPAFCVVCSDEAKREIWLCCATNADMGAFDLEGQLNIRFLKDKLQLFIIKVSRKHILAINQKLFLINKYKCWILLTEFSPFVFLMEVYLLFKNVLFLKILNHFSKICCSAPGCLLRPT